MVSKRIIVRGKVQKVGFRYYVSQQARSLGVRGEVWNRRDGAVELLAEHDSPDVLSRLIEHLHDGPGHVDSVCVADDAPRRHVVFRIGPSR